MIENDHAANVLKEFLYPFHQMGQDPEEERVEGIRAYDFMWFTMGYMPECVVDIFDAVRFQSFNVGIVLSGSIRGVWSGSVWSIWEFSKLIGGGDADWAAVGGYAVDHNIFHVVC